MGQTSIYQLPYPEPADPADVPTDMRELAEAIDPLLRPSRVTSLPGSPVDGQEVYYQADATAGIMWHLRYRAAISDAYKWELVGGPSLYHAVETSESTASTTYIDLGAGPQLTAPLAGIYRISGDTLVTTGGTAGSAGLMAPKFGAAAASDNDRITHVNTPAASQAVNTGGRTMQRTLTAGTLVKCQYRAAGPAASFAMRSLQLLPVRVG